MLHTDERDQTLTGEVALVVFRNDRTGFGVVELAGDDVAEGARAAGPLSALVVGQPVRLRGRWTEHERYGRTFTTVAYEIVAPQTTEGLSRFLSSERFPGVGDALAERIVDAFGLAVDEVIVKDPGRLASVRGVSANLAETIATSWRQAGALPELVAGLTAAGLPPAAITELHRRFGADASAAVERDPYVVLDIPGVGWGHAERLAREHGLARTDPRRLSAAARTCLVTERDRGHVVTGTADLRRAVERLAGVDAIDARRGIETAAERGTVVRDEGLGTGGGAGGSDGAAQVWALPEEREAEAGLAGELARLLAAWRGGGDPGAPDHRDPDRPGPEGGEAGPSEDSKERTAAADGLTTEQRRGVRAALGAPVSVLTGGPGTGKTRTVRAVVERCAAMDLRVALCAPTGRAAKRMEELTGHPATTVHRLLEAQPATFSVGDDDAQAEFRFAYGAHRRLPHDLVVMDEASMTDTALGRALVESVPDGGRLLFVGDTDQLPSVGPGAVLRDVLSMDPELVPRTHLTHVHRQAARSRIVMLAHELRQGRGSSPPGRHGDVFSVPQSAPGLADRIAEIVALRAPEFYGLPPSDVQVLSPMYRGAGGIDTLNRRLSERLNPAGGRPAVSGLREGDRVVQTRNDAELDVANGEVGEVTLVDARGGSLAVAFPGGEVTFRASQARNLRPAWCLSVHKSQGGEWPVVVLALDPAHRTMLYRELLYTAITRARVGLLLVGDADLVRQAALRSGSGLLDRRTALVDRFNIAVAGRGLGQGSPGAPASSAESTTT